MSAAPPFDRSITAIIATYNRADYIGEALRSMLAQREPPAQLIVVDDGSDEDIGALVAGIAPQAEYIRKDNGGKSSAINVGLQRARHRWVWLFDDDDIALPQATGLLLDALQAAPQARFAFSGQIVADETSSGELKERRTILPDVADTGALLLELLHGYRFQMQSMLIDRAALCELGGMDERFLRGQDYELTIRLARHLQGVQVNAPTFVWRQHPGERGPKTLRHGEGDRTRQWTRFEMMLGQQIRADFALGEYLIPPQRADLPDGEARATALLRRATVMLTKGLIAESAVDLAAVAAARGPDGALAPGELDRVLRSALSQRFVSRFVDSPQPFLNNLCELPDTRLVREVQACISRAFFYEGRQRTRARPARSALLHAAAALARRAGLRALARAWMR